MLSKLAVPYDLCVGVPLSRQFTMFRCPLSIVLGAYTVILKLREGLFSAIDTTVFYHPMDAIKKKMKTLKVLQFDTNFFINCSVWRLLPLG